MNVLLKKENTNCDEVYILEMALRAQKNENPDFRGNGPFLRTLADFLSVSIEIVPAEESFQKSKNRLRCTLPDVPSTWQYILPDYAKGY